MKGWQVVPDVIEPALLDRLRRALPYAWVECQNIMNLNGIKDADQTVHHLLAVHDPTPYLDLIEALEPLDPLLTEHFEGKYILNSLGGAINSRAHASYAQKIHRDVRSFQPWPMVLNTLVMLDDFTVENGATQLFRHSADKRPTEAEFALWHIPVVGNAGDVLLFNSNIWHRGGVNTTDKPRRSLTPMFCRPWVKPQFDYCRALAGVQYDLSDYQEQVIGYHARVPSTLAQWYQPPDRRWYRGDQG